MLVKKKGSSNEVFWPWDNEKQLTSKRYNRSVYESIVRLTTDYCFIQQAYVFHSYHSPNGFCQLQLTFPGDLVSGFSILLLRSSSASSMPSTFRQPVSEEQSWKTNIQDVLRLGSVHITPTTFIGPEPRKWPDLTATGIRKSCLWVPMKRKWSIKIWILSPKKLTLVP